MAAARSEVLYERRQGRVKLLLCRGLQVYYGNVQVLFDVDFEIDEGEIVALLGTNGAGKSTLLKAICGVVEADKGAVIFDGRDITHAPPNEIAAHGISQVPGGHGVFPGLTVRENLRVAGLAGAQGAGRPGRTRRPGARAVPDPGRPHGRAGQQPVRGPAADAGPGHGLPGPPSPAAHRRALAGVGPGGGRAAPAHGGGHPRAGHHGDPGRAVGQPGPDHRRDGLLHGEGRDPLPRPHRRAAGPPRHPALGVPGGGRGRLPRWGRGRPLRRPDTGDGGHVGQRTPARVVRAEAGPRRRWRSTVR